MSDAPGPVNRDASHGTFAPSPQPNPEGTTEQAAATTVAGTRGSHEKRKRHDDGAGLEAPIPILEDDPERLAKEHGGRVAVEGEEGSTFTVFLLRSWSVGLPVPETAARKPALPKG